MTNSDVSICPICDDCGEYAVVDENNGRTVIERCEQCDERAAIAKATGKGEG